MANSFKDLYQRREQSPAYLAERMAVILLAELNSQMKRLGMSNSDLARAASVSPAYITKLFRGPSNLSLETIAKLALAVGCQPHAHLAMQGAQVRWFDVMQQREAQPAKDRSIAGFGAMMKALEKTGRLHSGASNDRKFVAAEYA